MNTGRPRGGRRAHPVVLICSEFVMQFESISKVASILDLDKAELDRAMKRKDGHIGNINGVEFYIDEAIPL